MRKKQIVVGIGSNLGDRLYNVQKAISLLEKKIDKIRVSSIFETAAQLLPNSPPEWNLPFYNCAIVGETELEPCELIVFLKEIERRIGHRSTIRWSPRHIDLDILAIEDLVIQEDGLNVPHKELLNRPFALQPMAQLLPYWRYPDPKSEAYGKSMVELAHKSRLEFSKSCVVWPYIVGIVNVTPDSFSDGGLFLDPEKAAQRAIELWEQGASLVDLGAVSTRPGATLPSLEAEWERLSPVLKRLSQLDSRPRISVDTYQSKTAIRVIEEFEVEVINFQGETIDQELAEKVEQRGKQLVIMHTLGIPPSRKKVLQYDQDPIAALLSWGEKKIEELERKGLDRRRLIFDPGICFGKTSLQNQMILQRVKELKALGLPLFVGHSRKSFLSSISVSRPKDRDLETRAISLFLADQGVDFLRVHDVEGHMAQLVAHKALSVGKGGNVSKISK